MQTCAVPEAHTVEISRYRLGGKDEDIIGFEHKSAALEYAKRMLVSYGYRVWVDGLEYTAKDFKTEELCQTTSL